MRTRLHSWKFFSYKELDQIVLLPVKNSCPPAESNNETPAISFSTYSLLNSFNAENL